MKPIILLKATSSRGAQMGRPNVLPENRNAKGKLRLVRLKWVDGDYDQGGAYWGRGPGREYIYHAVGDLDGEEFTTRIFVRCASRTDAKSFVRLLLPNVTFYR